MFVVQNDVAGDPACGVGQHDEMPRRLAGQHFGIPSLEQADAVVALLVTGIIALVVVRLAKQTLNSLLDATPPEVRDQIQGTIRPQLEAIPDVLKAERIRVRRAGSNYFVDLTLGLPRNLTFQRAEQVTE